MNYLNKAKMKIKITIFVFEFKDDISSAYLPKNEAAEY